MGSFQYGMLVEQVATVPTSGTAYTMTNTSLQIQYFTGATAQTVKLPPTTSMSVGQFFNIFNGSSATITMEYQDSTSFLPFPTIPANTSQVFTLVSTSTTNGTWVALSISVGSTTGTGNYVLSASPTLTGTVAAAALTLSGALTLSTFTQGSVLFAGVGGLISQDNADFFWDNTNLGLRLGINTPIYGGFEGLSVQANTSTIPGGLIASIATSTVLNTTTANTQSLLGIYTQVNRDYGATVADSSNVFGLYIGGRTFYNTSGATAYNYSTTGAVCGIQIASTIVTSAGGGGTATAPVVAGLRIVADNSTWATARKIAVDIVIPTGGAAGNAGISDNEGFSGNWFIYQGTTSPNQFAGPTSIGGTNSSGSTGNAANAVAGVVGELLATNGSGPAVAATGVYAVIASLALTAGDWDVEGLAILNLAAGVLATAYVAGISTSPSALDANSSGGYNQDTFAAISSASYAIPTGVRRISTTGITIYLIGYVTYSGPVSTSLWPSNAILRARRMR